MRRVISNIEIAPRQGAGREGAELVVHSNFILGVARAGAQRIWMGRSLHRLRVQGDTLKIAHKKVLLINSDQEMPLLQFLI